MKLWKENAKDISSYVEHSQQQIGKGKAVAVKNEVKTLLFKKMFLNNKVDTCSSLSRVGAGSL
jgi:hypothetical protein